MASSKPENVDSAVERVLGLLESLSAPSWSADQFEDFLTRVGDRCGQYLLAVQQSEKKGTSGAAKTHDSAHDADAEEDEEEEVSEKQAMEEVATALERLRQHVLKKYPYGTLEEPTHRPYEPVETAPGSKRARTEDGAEGTVCASPLSAAGAVVSTPVYAIDAYLYPEDTIEELVRSGRVCREYCTACGGTSIALADFLTHSFSVEQLIYLSTVLLPNLPDLVAALPSSRSDGPTAQVSSTNTIVDVGSRLGVVLWSCYFSTRAGLLPRVQRVVGVELSREYCAVQRELAKRFCARPIPIAAADTAEAVTPAHLQLNVVESSCFEGNGASALAAADVLILHNVFEYFCDSRKGHLGCWKQLHDLVAHRHGQLWITSPSLEETFGDFSEADARELFPSVLGLTFNVDGPTSAKDAGQTWLHSFLEPVDVKVLAEVFVTAWTSKHETEGSETGSHAEREEEGGCGGCGDHGCGDHGCCDDAKSEHSDDEALAEMKELIGNIYVYRVR